MFPDNPDRNSVQTSWVWMAKKVYPKLTTSPNISLFSHDLYHCQYHHQLPNRAITLEGTPQEVFTDNRQPFGSKEWYTFTNNMALKTQLHHLLPPIKWLYRIKVPHTQKNPQQSQGLLDPCQTGSHKALPITY